MRDRVITIHGIQSAGAWQDDVARVFQPYFDSSAIRYKHYRHLGPLKLILDPYVLLLSGIAIAVFVWEWPNFLHSPWFIIVVLGVLVTAYLATYVRRKLAFDKVLEQVSPYVQPEYQSQTHLIAHSLGTYLMGRTLRTRPNVHIGRIVFIGCVLPRSFPWAELTGMTSDPGYRFLQVRNEIGSRDFVVYAAWIMSWLIRGLGLAGLKGFRGAASLIHTLQDPSAQCSDCGKSFAPIHNVVSEYLGHSDTFVGSGYAETFWLPYLWGIEPREYQEFLALCNLAVALEREWSAVARAAGNVDPRLIQVEMKLLNQEWKWSRGSFRGLLIEEIRSRYTLSDARLEESVALAARGTWQSVGLGLEARRAREDRRSSGLAPDQAADAAMRWLNPRDAVRRAVALLP